MDNFIVSARKYRPASFQMVVGQDVITQTLKSAISNKHLAQAYLFCGPRGVGKTTCARIFAKTINCSNLGPNAEACNECESCKAFNAMRSYNIHELDAASNNKVEDIRSLNEQVRIPPQIGQYSIYIIDEVHMLTTQAFNAFLKTLEEPPAHAIFILATTEKHKIISTILSRCQIFDFNRIRVEDIINRLKFVAQQESVVAEEEALYVIARKADGAMRDALSIFDQMVSLCGKNITYKSATENLNVLDYDYYFKIVDAIVAGDLSTVLLTFDEIIRKGFDEYNFLVGLNSHFRDLLVSKDEATAQLLEATIAIRQLYTKQSSICPIPFLYKALDIGSSFDVAYKSTKNTRLHVELCLIKLCSLFPHKEIDEKKNDDHTVDTRRNDAATPSVPRDSSGNRASPTSNVTTTPEPPSSTPPQGATPNGQERKVAEPPTISEGKTQVGAVRTNSLSIKNLLSGTQPSANDASTLKETKSQESSPSSSVPEKDRYPLTQEHLSSQWNAFVETQTGEGPRALSMFHSMKPQLEEGGVISFSLSNVDQKDLFVQNYKFRLINYLHDKFLTPIADISVTVNDVEVEEMLYTDEQKYKYLVGEYAIIQDFKKAFNLDY